MQENEKYQQRGFEKYLETVMSIAGRVILAVRVH
jgi:hypothetical protein